MLSKKLLLITVVLGAFALSTIASGSPAHVIRGDSQIGSFHTYMHLSDAIRIFGQPTSQRAGASYTHPCTASWRGLGLQLVFRANGCTNRSIFFRGVASNRSWRTARGLAVGDPSTKIRTLYPDGKQTGGSRWTLLKRPRNPSPTLEAVVVRGRVIRLVVSAATGTDIG